MVRIPQPDKTKPFVQIEFVFNERASFHTKNSSSLHYENTLNLFKKYLADRDGIELRIITLRPYFIDDEFDVDCHYQFHQYLVKKKCAPRTIQNALSDLKQVIIHSLACSYIDNEVFFVTHSVNPRGKNKTESRTAYEANTATALKQILNSDYSRARLLAAPYIKSNVGRDPRIRSSPTLRFSLQVINDFLKHDSESYVINAFELSKKLNISYSAIKKNLKFWEKLGVLGSRITSSPLNTPGVTYKLCRHPTTDEITYSDPEAYGWRNFSNVIWYFENEMQCNAISSKKTDPLSRRHKCFFSAIEKYHGGSESVYSRLGVSPRIEGVFMASLMAVLAMHTGLNVESLKSLKIDCLKIEPLTNTSYIEYIKYRSTGRKELPLWDENEEILTPSSTLNKIDDNSFVAKKPIPLLPTANKVKHIIECIISLTSEIRKTTSEDEKTKLFIFFNSKANQPEALNQKVIEYWGVSTKKRLAVILKNKAKQEAANNKIEYIETANRVIDLSINSASINISRFRPLLATELVIAGAPLHIVQAVLGHADIWTTEAYLAKHQMEVQYYKEVHAALSYLKTNKHEHFKILGTKEDLRTTIAHKPSHTKDSGYIFETGTPLFCRDPSDPSNYIKSKIKGWKDGSSTCTKWNMCLFCKEVIIIDFVLPKLIAYQRRLRSDLECGLIKKPANYNLVNNTVKLIDEILNPKNGFFTISILDDARVRAESYSTKELNEFFYDGVGAWA